MYVDLTGIGLLYAFLLYREFGIHILDFAEIGDFLLAAFKAPRVTLSVLLAQVLFVCLFLFLWRVILASSLVSSVTRALEYVRAPGSETRTGRLVQARQFFSGYVPLIVGTVAGIVLLVATAISSFYFARSQAHAIKQDEQTQVVVQYRQFSNTTEQVCEPGLELIGATQKVVFFYDSEDQRTLVIPQAQIVSVEVPDSR